MTAAFSAFVIATVITGQSPVVEPTTSYPPSYGGADMSGMYTAPPPGYIVVDGQAVPNPDLFATGDGSEATFDPLGTGYSGRVEFQHRTEGYGYDASYSAFGTFLPLGGVQGSDLTALQFNLLLDNHADIGTNLGIVNRRYIPEWDRTFGGSIFYDSMEVDDFFFNQLGFGVESLGTDWDVRANAYFPIGDDRSGPRGNFVQASTFIGRNILMERVTRYDRAMSGFDAEFGGPLPFMTDVLRGYVGVYHFQANDSDDVTGPQFRVEGRFGDSVTADLTVTHDDTFKTNVVFGIAFYLPGYSPAQTGSPVPLAFERLAEPIRRNQTITVDRQHVSDYLWATDGAGNLIDVAHVNSAALGPGDGSVENPYNTLGAAQTGSMPGSIIFGHANSTFLGENITLQDNQQFLGEGIQHVIQTQIHPIALPLATLDTDILRAPGMLNPLGDAITLADGNTVAGWIVEGAGGAAVRGNGIDSVTIDRNEFQSNPTGIVLNNIRGTATILENMVNGNNGIALDISTSNTDTLNTFMDRNTLIGNGDHALRVDVNDESTHTLVMERTSARITLPATAVAGEPIVEINVNNDGTLLARIEDNDFEDTALEAGMDSATDVYFHQFEVNANNASQTTMAFINNRLNSNREFFDDNPRNGPFGIDIDVSHVATFNGKLAENTSTLNYAISETGLSIVTLEDMTNANNTGTIFYWPGVINIDFVPEGSFNFPE